MSDRILPEWPLRLIPQRTNNSIDAALEKIFTAFGLCAAVKDFTREDISARTMCFIEEGRKRGWEFEALRGPFGFIPHYRMRKDGKLFRFEGLPTADFLRRERLALVDDKDYVKRRMAAGGFPVLPSRAFWFFQKEKAVRWGARELGFPLVVKPRNGTFARHITTNIRTEEELRRAISKSVRYSPTFLVEKYLGGASPDASDGASVSRVTVVDFEKVFSVRRAKPSVVGDGAHTVAELISTKNSDPVRGNVEDPEFVVFKVVDDGMTTEVLKEQGFSRNSTPSKGAVVYLQRDPFVRLGADLIEETERLHPDNIKLFKDVARYFDVRLVGLDFLANDTGRSWKEQECAILELNSIPCIEVHEYPTEGKPQNVAGAIADMVEKYYK